MKPGFISLYFVRKYYFLRIALEACFCFEALEAYSCFALADTSCGSKHAWEAFMKLCFCFFFKCSWFKKMFIK